MTRALPRALASWAEELAPFSDEARATVGPWLPSLERLLGARADHADPAGEPDGFSGLGRHGRYERLALSQWGLLDAAPDEFLRRAGSSEHLFLQVARSARVGGRRVVVLFDTGPAQLGAPRLVHLAWLLVVSRRAQRGGITLSWGILQRPQALRDGGDAGAVRALLAARSPGPVLPGHVAAWRAELGPPGEAEERWVVSAGGRHLHEPLGATSLTVLEPDEPEGRSLRVEALLSTRARSRALLPLPDGHVSARLLRDPFAFERTSTRKDETLEAGAQLVFSGAGHKVVARLANRDVVVLPVPREPVREVRPLARFSPAMGEVVLAAGWNKGAFHAITAGEGVALEVRRGRRHRRQPLVPRSLHPRPAHAVLYPLMVDRHGSSFWFPDGGWHLHRGDRGGGSLEAMTETVLACGWGDGTLFSIGRVGSGDIELFEHSRRGIERRVLFQGLPLASDGLVALGPGRRPAIVAVTAGDGNWVVKDFTVLGSHAIRLAGAPPVYGAAHAQHEPCLLVRARDGEELQLVSRLRVHETLPMPGPVDHACLQPGGRVIAAQIDGGVVLIERKGRILMRWGGR